MTTSSTRSYQRLAWFFIVLFVSELVYPNIALALTSGPTQPEVRSFEPVGTTEMVNLFSGDFTYNIPLFEVPGPEGGYPVNLFYNSVTSMDEEASWTGLGWNINIGSLGRMMRGLPDDFSGEEQVERRLDMKPQERVSVGGHARFELLGLNLPENQSASLSLSVNYIWDSYKGVGMDLGIGASASAKSEAKANSTYQYGASMGLNLSTIDGASSNTGFSISKTTTGIDDVTEENSPVTDRTTTKTKGAFNAGWAMNARDGLSGVSLGYSRSVSKSNYQGIKIGSEFYRLTKGTSSSAANSYGASLSFGTPSYAPSVGIPWAGFGLTGTFSFAPGAAGTHVPFGINGSYNFQEVVGGGAWKAANAYGYNYLEGADALSRDFSMDFNRTGGGAIHYHTRFLSIPNTTYDAYNVMGQGVGGMYRAHRNEFGMVYDPNVHSSSGSGSLGLEGGPAIEVGVDVQATLSVQKSGRWLKDDVFNYGNNAAGKQYSSDYEPFYYRVAGDMAAEATDAYDYMGGADPLRLRRSGYNIDLALEKSDRAEAVSLSSRDNTLNDRDGRKPRSMLVQPVRNVDLLDNAGNELLNLYDIKYYAGVNGYLGNTPNTPLVRPSNKQNAGFTVLGNNGVRWIYALPVMNVQQREVICSHDLHNEASCYKNVELLTDQNALNGDEGTTPKYKHPQTNEYLDEKKIPAYAHSYMLTSVVGTDYADVDDIVGPSDGDVGYWMKANYVQTTDQYQWRAPFFGANYLEGQKNVKDDNNASFSWGERENYLPASIETKTHIAYFYISPRDDARGAHDYIQNENSPNTEKYGAYSYKLDRIELYSKKELQAGGTPEALKKIHFEYTYELCPGVENNATGGGKLTLKKVWFTYEGSSRGALSPYQFSYGDNPNAYAYDYLSVDRWGGYRGTGVDICNAAENPYVPQGTAAKSDLDEYIAAWHLKEITTPSGATIELELERDDYAYVQDKVATQMMKVKSVLPDEVNKRCRVYFDVDASIDTNEELDQFVADLPVVKNPMKENPILGLPFVPNTEDAYLKQVYLKARVDLTSGINPIDQETWEDVSIYAFLSKDVNGREIHFATAGVAYIDLEYAKIKTQEADPISVFSWMHLKGGLPRRIYGADLGAQKPEDLITSLYAVSASFDALLKGYYKFARSWGFGRDIDFNKTFVRLNTPTKVKYGGDIRVKQVTLKDQWNTDEISTIGVTYDYTTKDEKGNIISSGVAENEPSIGYDACPLHYANIFYEWDVFGNNNQINIDVLPLNQSYYPGAKVCYSKVTVRSIASNIAKGISEGTNNASANDLAQGFGKTGQTVNEFYTCKDFPIIAASTNLSKQATAPWLTQALNALMSLSPISINNHQYTGTQGYSIEMNDMHGKPKKVTTYAQNADGSISEEPLTYVKYVYRAKERVKAGYNPNNEDIVYGLDNEVDVLVNDNPIAGVVTEKRLMGVEQEFFMDSQKNFSESSGGGFQFNTDVLWLFPPITVPIPIPNVNIHQYTTQTAVTNKIIKRHGILKETIAYDGQSRIVTTNLVYNQYTGQPLLTTVDNQLGGKIYNYSIPADFAHSTMGAASENWGSQLKGSLTATGCTSGYYEFVNTTGQPYKLIVGDEFILTESVPQQGQSMGYNKMRAVYMGKLKNNSGQLTEQFDVIGGTLSTNTNASVHLRNTRSGNRNLLTATVAQYSSVDTDADDDTDDGNPLTNRTSASCIAEVVSFAETTVNSQNVVELSPVNGPLLPYQTINNVLSASANAYRDHWTMEAQANCNPATAITNPYLLGEKGVWRMESSYAYVDHRKQVPMTSIGSVDIKQSGTVDNVPLYNWSNPFFEYCQNKWMRTEDITQYNRDGDPVEARDVIGNYQAEIYGLNDNLVIAKGANARYYEMGFESFEEPNRAADIQTVANNGYYSEGNLNFFPKGASCASTLKHQESYRLSYPMPAPSSGSSYLLVREPYEKAAASDPHSALSAVHLNLVNQEGKETQVTVDAAQVQVFPVVLSVPRLQVPGLGIILDESTQSDFTVYKVDFSRLNCPPNWSSGTYWSGHVTLEYKDKLVLPSDIYTSGGLSCASIVKGFAHTGNYSLKLFESKGANCGALTFPQRSLHLEAGQEYVISFWMSKFSDQSYTLGEMGFDYSVNPYFSIELGVGNNVVQLTPSGPMIEGWQKVEAKFTYSGDPLDKYLRFKITTSDDVINPLLIDDVRVFPADGHIQTYVYDPIDYKLRATLDDNNYATFYIYNPEGDLIAVKRETERGIKTIQESRNFIKPTN